MAKSRSRTVEALKSTAVAIFLIGIVAYYALTSIPAAQRPTFEPAAPTITSGAVPGGR